MALSAEVPEDLKPLVNFLKRAEELDDKDPVVAYYCRYHFVTLGLAKRTPQNKAVLGPYLMRLLDKLEADKTAYAQTFPAIGDRALGREHVLTFASKVFLKADNEDRAGNANSKTARNFVVAATFLEVLNHFGELDEEVSKRIMYAKWKAADILKAEREGRRPVPGPPVGDGGDDSELLDGAHPPPAATEFAPAHTPTAPSHQPAFQAPYPPQPSSAPASSPYDHAPASSPYAQPPAPAPSPYSQPPAPAPSPYTQPPPSYAQPPASYAQPPASYAQPHPPASYGDPSAGARPPPQGGFTYLPTGPAAQPPPSPAAASAAPPPVAAPRAAPAPAARPAAASGSSIDLGGGGAGGSYDPAVINAVAKHARFVISSLQYEDVPAAIDNLEKALALLRNAQRH